MFKYTKKKLFIIQQAYKKVLIIKKNKQKAKKFNK